MKRRSGTSVTKPPETYLPPTTEFSVEEIVEIASEARTLFEVCQRTRISRQTIRKLLRASEAYHEVEFGFGNDVESSITRLEKLREEFG
jgi:response regulator of citrate/malate metabolism